MSAKATFLTDPIFDYLVDNFTSETSILKQVRELAAEKGLPPIHISPDQAAFIQIFLKSINAKYALEVGSLAGYSAIVIASALQPEGKLITIEKSGKHAEIARQNVEAAGMAGKIEVVNADAKDFLKNFKPQYELDFVFVDADKKSYIDYLDMTVPLLRPKGVFAADNAFAFGQIVAEIPERNPNEVSAIREFNMYLRNHPALESCLLPVGDGMIMGMKK